MGGLEPQRDRGGQVGRLTHDRLGGASSLERDDVLGADAVARDVHAAAIDHEMAVTHELPRLCARAGEAEAVDDVVEARLEHPQQVLAGRAGAARRLGVRVAELLLEQAVVAARLLLLAQLQQVFALLDAAAAVLSRRIRAPLDRAFLGEAALALQEEFEPLPAALAALRSRVAGHYPRLRVLGRTPWCACGETSLTPRISSPAAWSERIAVSRPEPGPLTKTSTVWQPGPTPLPAALRARE